ncbi:unnamed protein product [Psylliodes chrysocephalus]|uniref:Transmembrane protein 42 n=1 Tax=Psylliodes chrysocephalus TaxID=3402493 RepID=A0A9P0G9V7_9CUCU|nr:unnamed protein product [Psylliodes chrysocephala]
MYGNVHFAVISGVCASTGSVFGKLSGLPNFEGLYVLKIAFFVLMLLFNTACMTFFVKALQQSLSLKATLISSSTNYVFTALAGFIIFQETTSLLWWSGISLIILGLILIVSERSDVNSTKVGKTKIN